MAETSTLTICGVSYRSGSARFIERFVRARTEALKPPPKLTLSEWANRYAHLSAETSADAGKFRAFGYQNGIMDAITDPTVRRVTVMKSARVGYTKILDHVVGDFIHQDPSPMLLVQPRVEDAEDYSRTEIAPMLRDTPVLAEIAGDLKAKDSNQRILKRSFRNGASVAFIGANSPGGFRRITARIAAFDEIDGYPSGGAGDEGDQIALGIKRTESFWNRKIIDGSTPTLKGISRIERSFNESDQRRYHVPCPGCGHLQVLRWSNLTWNKERDEQGQTIAHHPKTAHFVCEANGCIIEEHDKPAMVDAGRWIAERPFTGHAGFHIWAGYSLFENASWRNLVEEFLRVRRNPAELKTFVNTALGETWEEQGETVEANALAGRAEVYGPDALPVGVVVLTAGVDTQDDRLEVHIDGYGAREESWSCQYEVLYGDPAQPAVWNQLDELLRNEFTTLSGRKLRVRATCIDSGGHHAERVYAFCRDRRRRGVYATKGASGARPIWPKRASRGGKKGAEQVFIVGVDTAKDAIYGRLRIKAPGPGYIHFPDGEDFDAAYFDQLTAESVVTRYREGRPYRVWVLPKGKRNEVLDTKVLALAALKSLALPLDRMKTVAAPALGDDGAVLPAPAVLAPEPDAPTPPRLPPRPYADRPLPRGNWLNSGRGWLR